MKYLRGGLGAVLLFAVVIRVSAEIIAPAIPVLTGLFFVAAIVMWLARGFVRSGR